MPTDAHSPGFDAIIDAARCRSTHSGRRCQLHKHDGDKVHASMRNHEDFVTRWNSKGAIWLDPGNPPLSITTEFGMKWIALRFD